MNISKVTDYILNLSILNKIYFKLTLIYLYFFNVLREKICFFDLIDKSE